MQDHPAPSRGSLYINKGSRRGRKWFEAAEKALRDSGFELIDCRAFEKAPELQRAVKAAVERGDPMVVVGGGDGTISSVAEYFLDHKSVLGVMPLGTGNSFARDLGINADVTQAAKVICEGKCAEIDVGWSSKGYFLNVASSGLTVQIAQALTGNQKRMLGRAAYLIALTKGMLRLRQFRIRLTMDGKVHEDKAFQVVIGNGRFHAGAFPITPDAEITDGVLHVYAITGERKWALVRAALHLPGGKHVNLAEVPVFECQTCRLETIPPKKVNLDGEIVGRAPMEFRVIPRAIRCMVPPDFRG